MPSLKSSHYLVSDRNQNFHYCAEAEYSALQNAEYSAETEYSAEYLIFCKIPNIRQKYRIFSI